MAFAPSFSFILLGADRFDRPRTGRNRVRTANIATPLPIETDTGGAVRASA